MMLPSASLSLDQLHLLAGGRIGIHDVACPMCGPERRSPANRTRKVLRLWLIDEKFGTWSCARCESKGEAHVRGGHSISIENLRKVREAARAHEKKSAADRLKVARWLWRQSTAIRGTVVERYLRDVRGCHGPLPATLRFLASRGDHPPAMIAPFGIPREPEPGRLQIDEEAVLGVHVTRLLSDGSGKAEGNAKIMIGRCSGAPIVLAPMNDLLGLAVTEGIEDAISVHHASGIGAWAAGAALVAAGVPTFANLQGVRAPKASRP